MNVIKLQIDALNKRLELIALEQEAKKKEWMTRLNVIKEKMRFAKDEYIKRNNLPSDVDDAVTHPVEATISKIEAFLSETITLNEG